MLLMLMLGREDLGRRGEHLLLLVLLLGREGLLLGREDLLLLLVGQLCLRLRRRRIWMVVLCRVHLSHSFLAR